VQVLLLPFLEQLTRTRGANTCVVQILCIWGPSPGIGGRDKSPRSRSSSKKIQINRLTMAAEDLQLDI